MSSILRALKKLEDAPVDQNGVAPWQGKFADQHAHHGRWRQSALWGTPGIVATVAILAVLGWLASRGPHGHNDTVPEATSTELAARTPEQASAPSRSQPSPVSQEPSAPSQPSATHLAVAKQHKPVANRADPKEAPEVTAARPRITPPPSDGNQRAPSTSGEKIPERHKPVLPDDVVAARAAVVTKGPVPAAAGLPLPVDTAPIDESPAASSRASAPQPPAIRPAARRHAGQAVAAPAQPAPVAISPSTRRKPTETEPPPAPVLNRLRDPAVNLQAIAWSDDAEQRMAMINEQIVREGQTIEGYTVATIGEGSVTVRRGSEAWELRYGH